MADDLLQRVGSALDLHPWGTHRNAAGGERTGCACGEAAMGSADWMKHFFAVLQGCVRLPDDREQLRNLCLAIKRHRWSTATDALGLAKSGCAACNKTLYTPHQWMTHLREGVLPESLTAHA
jgi:hypothetical protein